MKAIRVRRERDEYSGDVCRVQEALVKNGFLATDDQCRELWQMFSDSMCAGWMCVPDDDGEILASVSPYFDEVDLSPDEDGA